MLQNLCNSAKQLESYTLEKLGDMVDEALS